MAGAASLSVFEADADADADAEVATAWAEMEFRSEVTTARGVGSCEVDMPPYQIEQAYFNSL
jgi:hypothetical protein